MARYPFAIYFQPIEAVIRLAGYKVIAKCLCGAPMLWLALAEQLVDLIFVSLAGDYVGASEWLQSRENVHCTRKSTLRLTAAVNVLVSGARRMICGLCLMHVASAGTAGAFPCQSSLSIQPSLAPA